MAKKIGVLAFVVGLLASQAPAHSAPPAAFAKSPQVKLLRQIPADIAGAPAWTTDLAFQDDLVVAGADQGIALYRTQKDAPYIEQVGAYDCPGAQQDVSVLGDFVFASNQELYGALDGAGLNTGVSTTCNNTGSVGLEGVRIVDISDVSEPKQVGFVPTPCGSHTHTLVPGKETSYIYSSSPSSVPFAPCPMSIISFPTADPAQAKLTAIRDTGGLYGCHDITVFPDRRIAAAACVEQTQLWDISDPASPKVISRIQMQGVNPHHSTAFSWDGKILLIGEEQGGSCNADAPTEGALWFFDISKPDEPKKLGFFNIPRNPGHSECWTHNFNVIPMKDGSYVASVGYFGGGLSVVDFSNPKKPVELAYFLPQDTRMWSAYWYNGRIYGTDWKGGRGLYVLSVKGTGLSETRPMRILNPQVQSL